MKKELLSKSIEIFETQEKWDALFEIYNLSNEIIEYWLAIGARALRESFGDNSVWGCKTWGSERDSRWFLKEFGEESLGIGYGWTEVELHLHQINSPNYGYNHAADLLSSSVFKPLLELFELKNLSRYVGDGGLACNTTLNPFSGAPDVQVRRRELAWLAAHKTKKYVDEMGGIIRRLTDNPIHTGLFHELNRQVRERTAQFR